MRSMIITKQGEHFLDFENRCVQLHKNHWLLIMLGRFRICLTHNDGNLASGLSCSWRHHNRPFMTYSLPAFSRLHSILASKTPLLVLLARSMSVFPWQAMASASVLYVHRNRISPILPYFRCPARYNWRFQVLSSSFPWFHKAGHILDLLNLFHICDKVKINSTICFCR